MSDLSAKPEKNYRAKTKQADSQSGYLEDKIVGSTYINITEEDGTVGKRLKVEVDASALVAGIVDHKVKVSSNDTTANYLLSKLVAGNAITLTKQNPAGNEKIIIDANYTEGTGIYITADTISLDADLDDLNDVVSSGLGNGGILVYDNASEKWVCSYALEGTFSGTATKVPLSSAIKTLLQALYITNATDCGSGGDSIMYKTISIPVSNSCICEGQTGFSDHYPSIFTSFDLLPNNLLTFAERSLGLKLITTETDPSDQRDGYGAVLLEAMIDEDCSDNNTIFLDTVIQTKNSGGEGAQQTNLRCFAVGFNEGQVVKTSAASDVKILDAAGNGLYKKVSFAIDLGAITASSPFSIKFILFSGSALIAADAGYQSADEFTLLSARVRYPIKTINLRSADINM